MFGILRLHWSLPTRGVLSHHESSVRFAFYRLSVTILFDSRSLFALAVIRLSILVALAAPLEGQGRISIDQTPRVSINLRDYEDREGPSDITDATMLANGRIVIADATSASVFVLTPRENVMVRLGGPGAGPGEFRAVGAARGCRGDSVFVWDLALMQVSVFAPDNRYVRNFRPAVEDQPFNFTCSASGVAVVGFGRPQSSATEPIVLGPDLQEVRLATSIVVSDFDGKRLGAIGNVVAGSLLVGSGGGGPRALSQRPLFDLAADVVLLADSASGSVTLFRNFVATSAIRPVFDAARAPTAEQFERAVDRVASLVRGPRQADFRAMQMRAPRPTQLPPYFALRADPAGQVWLQTSHPGSQRAEFQVFSQAGRQLASFTLPGDLELLEVGVAHLLVVERDREDGIPVLRVYTVNR